MNKTIISWSICTDEGIVDDTANGSECQLMKLIERTAHLGRRELLAEVHEVYDECTESQGFEHVGWLGPTSRLMSALVGSRQRILDKNEGQPMSESDQARLSRIEWGIRMLDQATKVTA